MRFEIIEKTWIRVYSGQAKSQTNAEQMTPNESSAKRRDQNACVGFASTILLFRGTAQRRNAGYTKYAQINAMTVPSTPPNPSSRSGLACTISRLAKPNDAQTIDQNEGGKVMRRASVARSGDFLPMRCARSASICQLNVM